MKRRNLSVLVGTEVMYIDQVESSNMIKMFARIGSRAPCLCHRRRKGPLAFLPPDELGGDTWQDQISAVYLPHHHRPGALPFFAESD